MTHLNRQVRVSVRLLSQSVDSTWGTPTESYAHDRWQSLISLAPLSLQAVLALQREGYYADWSARAHRLPAINDGDRLVTFVDDTTPGLVFHVAKAAPLGRWMQLYLREIGEIQS